MKRSSMPTGRRDSARRWPDNEPVYGGGRREGAKAALDRFRTRRDARGRMLSCLLEAPTRRNDSWLRRRAELAQEAVDWGFSWGIAEEVFEIAAEEGLEPALAFELLRCGVAVCGSTAGEGAGEGAEATAPAAGEPDWRSLPDPESARREWRYRASFRRLRRLLETHDTADSALAAFVAEPDTDDCGY